MTELNDYPLTVSAVADQAGVSTNAVRYYERYGIVQSVRTSSNARRFSVDAVCRVKLAVAAHRVGLTLAESAEILAEVPPMCPDLDLWAAACERLVAAGESRMAELESVVSQYRSLDFIRS